MIGQLRSTGALLEERLKITQDIAAANVEHLRLSQRASGLMVLDMRDEMDGRGTDHRDADREETRQGLERCMDEINALEAALKDVDQRLQDIENEAKK